MEKDKEPRPYYYSEYVPQDRAHYEHYGEGYPEHMAHGGYAYHMEQQWGHPPQPGFAAPYG